MFRRLVPMPKKQNHEQALKEIQAFLDETASRISERASSFVKELKYIQMVTQDDLFTWKYEIKQASISPICSKIMNENQNYIAFRCYDCMESISSCICAECFQNGNHKGHNYVQYQAINGCCDCGNDQSWNEKGFCKSHTKSNEITFQISPETQELYLKQFRLAFWIYFYLIKNQKVEMYKEKYGNALFGYLIALCQQNYQMKYLAYLLLTTPLSVDYKNNDAEFEIPILHRIFSLKSSSNQLNRFVSLTFQVFPVEQFRTIVLRQYFSKMRKKEYVFDRRHPLASLNFQFLSCVKLINKLIQNKTLQPLLLYPYQFVGISINLSEAFKKYYEDLDYIKNMRSSKQYHIIHLSSSNICQMCFYRNFSTQSKSRYLQLEEVMELNLDQIFLKTFGHFVKNIIDQKRLIEKCLSELVCYIWEAQVNTISLAHERAFALLTFAYFKGNLYQLLDESTCRKFVKQIFIDSQVVGQKQLFGLKHVIWNSLRTKLYIEQKSNYQMNYSAHEKYYLRLHPQKNFNEFLDISFHKIMMMICQYYENYPKIVQQALNKLTKQANLIQQRYQSQEFEKEKILIAFHKKFNTFLNFINTVTKINIDELVITNYIGLTNQQQIFQFYSRLIASFKSISIKDFKNLALSIINNEQCLQKFIKQHCAIDKGKIRCLSQAEPLQTFIYQQIFKKYQKSINLAELNFLHNKIRLPQFEHFVIFNPQTVQSIIQIAMNFIFKFSTQVENKESTQIFSLICFQILKIYLDGNSDIAKYKSFFITLLQPSFRKLISKELLEQITIIQKKEELESERDRIKDEKQTLDKKRREKLLAKKKEKQISLKINQSKVLGAYNSQMSIEQVEQNVNYCIYCKETKKQDLNFISYVGITNFYQQQLLKSDGYHIYFQSCGHKIHKSCFEMVMLKNKANYCFLCKQQTNILIPEISKNKDIEISRNESVDIITSYYAALINQREQIKAQLKQKDAFLSQNQVNFYQLIIDGLCKDFLYLGLHEYLNYKKIKYAVHYQLYSILKSISSQEMKSIFIKIRPKLNHKLNFILEYVQFKFQQLLLGDMDQRSFKQISSQEIQKINSFFTLFNNPHIQLSPPNLRLFTSGQMFIDLPQCLSRMSDYMGQCKLCRHVTNYIYICLKCGWTCCRKCLNYMYKHATYEHMDGSIFISCTNGGIKYLHSGAIFEDDSAYQNYLGQSYIQITSILEMSRCQKFNLNKRKIEILHKMGMEYGIHQKIFLNDK